MNPSDFPLSDLIACAERELSMRRNVYRGRVLAGSMTQEESDREIGMMDAIIGHLRKLASAGPLFREVWALMSQLPADVAPLLENAPSLREVCDAEPAQCRALASQQAALWLRVATKLPAAPTASTPEAPVAPEPVAAPGPQYCTAQQKEEILRLMNHPCNTRQEKTKLMLGINKFTPETAALRITELKQKAADYDGIEEVAGLKKALRAYVEQHGEALAMPECERLLALCESATVTAATLRDNLATARQEVEQLAA